MPRTLALSILAIACAASAARSQERSRVAAEPMRHARDTFTLTPLADGSLLAAGGSAGSGWLRSCELYDVATGTWRATGDLNDPRHGHAATRLADGRVLVTGSWIDGYTASSEIYDPATREWSQAAPMHHPRDRHTATLLPNGQVLIIGGFGDGGALASVEVYDPNTNQWSEWPDFTRPIAYHTVTPLNRDTLLIAGGEGQRLNYAYATLLTWSSKSFTAAPDLSEPRAYGETATRLNDGSVLLVGGEPNEPGPGRPALATVEEFRPALNAWSVRANLARPRYFHTATLLPDGRVLVAGGMSRAEPAQPQASTEVYDPSADEWSAGPQMSAGRARHCAAPLPDVSVLIAGGHTADGTPLASVDILRP